MRPAILPFLECPACEGSLACETGDGPDVFSGTVRCTVCHKRYPILAGVLILVSDVRGYLLEHVKGIARELDVEQIPKEYRAAFEKAKRRIQAEHIEEDLEAERINALYVMNHYLRAAEVFSPSPAIQELIGKYWDEGPIVRIRRRIETESNGEKYSLIELGCGVGGLFAALKGNLKSYLGLDSSFSSIALARRLALGDSRPAAVRENKAARRTKLCVPDDLLLGSISREVGIFSPPPFTAGVADFVVCELDQPPVKNGIWDMCAALNVIDMLADPAALPKMQRDLLRAGGIAIQSSPYIWHETVAAHLRETLPKGVKDSAAAVEWLYRQNGYEINHIESFVPWLFFKNTRQIELYAVHLFFASK